jgi:hypothetical protein
MAEYIKLEDAIAIIEEKQKELCPVGRYGRGYVYGSDRDKYDAWDEIIDALENIPSADVVPVVRCENCVHYDLGVCLKIYSDGNVHPEAWQPRRLEDFCSYGERKDKVNES